jgi:hypothetical protein
VNRFYRSGLPPTLLLLLSCIPVLCQEKPQNPSFLAMSDVSAVKVTISDPAQSIQSAISGTTENPSTIVLSGVASTARIADPNERVVFNGRVMRMEDFVAAVSSSSAVAQHPRSPEKRNHEKAQPVRQSQPSDLK